MPEFEIKLLITADSPEEALKAVALGEVVKPQWIRNATEGQFWQPTEELYLQIQGKNPQDDEPEIDDSVKFCPECETPNQFGETCNRCLREIQDENNSLLE